MGKVDNNKHIVNSSDGKSGRSGLNVMLRLIGLVKPLVLNRLISRFSSSTGI